MEMLPQDFHCPNCGAELELDLNERRERRFLCPACKSNIDLSKQGSISENMGNVLAASFDGNGGDLFGIYFLAGLISGGIFFAFSILMMAFSSILSKIVVLNLILFWSLYGLSLCVIYAYYKSKTLDFFYSKCRFLDTYLIFNGTFKEIFIGVLKAVPIFAALFIIFVLFAAQIKNNPNTIYVFYVVFFSVLFVCIQYAYFLSRRYRFSRIFYKERNFVFKGDIGDCVRKCLKNGLLSIITLGIYLPIYFHQRFSLLYNNLYHGTIPFRYEGNDKEFLRIALEGFFLTVLTFGIYYFWWKPKRYNYYMQHLFLGDARFQSEIKPKGLFNLIVPNLLLVIFTFGIGQAWAKVREAKFFVSSTYAIGSLDLPAIQLSEVEAPDSTGEAMAEYFGLGGVGMF